MNNYRITISQKKLHTDNSFKLGQFKAKLYEKCFL